MERVRQVLFDARFPASAEWLAGQTRVRTSGVQHLLHLLERIGQAEVCDVTPDGRPRWRWKDG
ncbi:MAG TPA: hypothetical protein VF916_09960 [Ktedonobacterales bacterium]